MAFQDFTDKECACDFVQNLESFKDTFVAFLDSAIAILTTIKAAVALWPADLGDQVKKAGLEASLVAFDVVMAPIKEPFAYVTNYFRPYSDCPPVATVAGKVTWLRNLLLSPFEDAQQEIEDYKEGLNLESSKIEQLDMAINMLKDFKDAITLCGAL